ncbi:MAG: SAM-dependent chlorinase/fluorinase [Candidatus Gygaella obscura]|nr:SAM-dependent chlorinase/fluorinase [Candidatus Gygaella obscura]
MIVSLLSDFGLEDNFVGSIKATMLNVNPNIQIVDITHNVKPHDIFSAAFLLEGTYKYFPKNTLHVVVVDPGVGAERKIIVVKIKDYMFLAPDNGVLALALKNKTVQKIIEVTNKKFFLSEVSNTFHGRDIFAPVAAHITNGVPLNKLGEEIHFLREISLPDVSLNNDSLSGFVIHIDRFGNLITNIKEDILKDLSKNTKIKIKDYTIKGLCFTYSDVEKNSPLCLINSFGYLEISVNCSSAKDFFHVENWQSVKVVK